MWLFIVFLLNSQILFAHPDNWGITVSTNLMKPFLGLINFAIEVKVAPHYACHLNVEKKFREKINHPDFMAQLGMRYYLSDKEEFPSKTFLGMNTGIIRSKNKTDGNGYLVGSEIGYKWMIWKRGSITPMGVLHYPPGQGKLLWGFEAPVGISF